MLRILWQAYEANNNKAVIVDGGLLSELFRLNHSNSYRCENIKAARNQMR